MQSRRSDLGDLVVLLSVGVVMEDEDDPDVAELLQLLVVLVLDGLLVEHDPSSRAWDQRWLTRGTTKVRKWGLHMCYGLVGIATIRLYLGQQLSIGLLDCDAADTLVLLQLDLLPELLIQLIGLISVLVTAVHHICEKDCLSSEHEYRQSYEGIETRQLRGPSSTNAHTINVELSYVTY